MRTRKTPSRDNFYAVGKINPETSAVSEIVQLVVKIFVLCVEHAFRSIPMTVSNNVI